MSANDVWNNWSADRDRDMGKLKNMQTGLLTGLGCAGLGWVSYAGFQSGNIPVFAIAAGGTLICTLVATSKIASAEEIPGTAMAAISGKQTPQQAAEQAAMRQAWGTYDQLIAGIPNKMPDGVKINPQLAELIALKAETTQALLAEQKAKGEVIVPSNIAQIRDRAANAQQALFERSMEVFAQENPQRTDVFKDMEMLAQTKEAKQQANAAGISTTGGSTTARHTIASNGMGNGMGGRTA